MLGRVLGVGGGTTVHDLSFVVAFVFGLRRVPYWQYPSSGTTSASFIVVKQ
jgi:hypothetical protein